MIFKNCLRDFFFFFCWKLALIQTKLFYLDLKVGLFQITNWGKKAGLLVALPIFINLGPKLTHEQIKLELCYFLEEVFSLLVFDTYMHPPINVKFNIELVWNKSTIELLECRYIDSSVFLADDFYTGMGRDNKVQLYSVLRKIILSPPPSPRSER